MATRGVADDLALADRSGPDERGHDVAEHVVGNGEQQQVARAGDVGRLGSADAGKQCLDALQRRGGVTGCGHDLVTGGAERCGKYGADTAGANNPDTGHQTTSLSFQSRGWVPDYS